MMTSECVLVCVIFVPFMNIYSSIALIAIWYSAFDVFAEILRHFSNVKMFSRSPATQAQ